MISNLYELPDLYDALLPVGAHLPFYAELARQHPEGVLELACGTGQLAVPIASTGVRTVGLDKSTAMLTSARTRAAASGVLCEFVEGDMRAFDMKRQFGLIFIARNSLLHLSSAQEIVAAFRAGCRHLLPGGVLAFDVFNPDPSILARPRGQRFSVLSVDSSTFGRLTVEGSHDYDAAAQVDCGTWFISTGDEQDKWVVPVVVRSIFPQELPLLLQAGGLRLLSRFGNLAKQAFGANSPQQVCVCEAAA
jgi:SAM-dependent methyltransferase